MSWWLYKKGNSTKWTAKILVPGKKAFRRSTGTSNRRTAERVAEKLEREALVNPARDRVTQRELIVGEFEVHGRVP